VQKHDDRDVPPSRRINYTAAVFVVIAAAYGPSVMWLLLRAATPAS
jgi:hypothetical protein